MSRNATRRVCLTAKGMGMVAFLLDLGRQVNPHPIESQEWMNWMMGYEEGSDEYNGVPPAELAQDAP